MTKSKKVIIAKTVNSAIYVQLYAICPTTEYIIKSSTNLEIQKSISDIVSSTNDVLNGSSTGRSLAFLETAQSFQLQTTQLVQPRTGQSVQTRTAQSV